MTAREPSWKQNGLPPIINIMQIVLVNLRARGENLTSQLSRIAARPLVTCVCPVFLVDELVVVFCTPYDWANGGSVDVLLHMVSMDLVLWEVGVILLNGYGTEGQNYVALLLGSEISAEFHCRNLILGI